MTKRSISTALLLFIVFIDYGAAADQQNVTFGIVPQQSATKLATKWVPFLDYLSGKISYKLEFKTAPDIPTFERRTAKGEYDICYMNPYHYVVFSEKPGYRAFAKERGKKIRGIIVVRKDAPFISIEDLAGKKVAFPSRAAFAASILIRSHFIQSNIPILSDYVKSHDSVYRVVAKGISDAGGGVERTFENVDERIRSQLRVIWKTGRFTPHAFAAHPGLPENLVREIGQAMFSMVNDPAASPLLKSIEFKGFEPAMHTDWDDVRLLHIDLPLE